MIDFFRLGVVGAFVGDGQDRNRLRASRTQIGITIDDMDISDEDAAGCIDDNFDVNFTYYQNTTTKIAEITINEEPPKRISEQLRNQLKRADVLFCKIRRTTFGDCPPEYILIEKLSGKLSIHCLGYSAFNTGIMLHNLVHAEVDTDPVLVEINSQQNIINYVKKIVETSQLFHQNANRFLPSFTHRCGLDVASEGDALRNSSDRSMQMRRITSTGNFDF